MLTKVQRRVMKGEKYKGQQKYNTYEAGGEAAYEGMRVGCARQAGFCAEEKRVHHSCQTMVHMQIPFSRRLLVYAVTVFINWHTDMQIHIWHAR